jgi:hypothetical protein
MEDIEDGYLIVEPVAEHSAKQRMHALELVAAAAGAERGRPLLFRCSLQRRCAARGRADGRASFER